MGNLRVKAEVIVIPSCNTTPALLLCRTQISLPAQPEAIYCRWRTGRRYRRKSFPFHRRRLLHRNFMFPPKSAFRLQGYQLLLRSGFLRAKAVMLSARLSHRNSVCPSVCLSVTRVDQAKTVQARISKSSPSAAWKTLVSFRNRKAFS